MSTILKALRRLEEDEPREAAAANAGESSPAPASSGDASEASEGTDGLRDRILAEERANRPTHEAAAGRAVSAETPDADIESSTSALRRFASLAAVALVVFVLGAVVVPALFDTPEPAGDVASAGPDEAGDARIAATGPADASPPPRSPAPSTPPRASAADTPAASASVSASASASLASATDTSAPAPAPKPPRAEVDLAKARAETLARRANPPEAMRPATADSVAVADLPVAPPSRAKASPRPAPESAASAKASTKPAAESAARTTPRRDAEPPVELALVAPTRTPPPAEAPAASTRAATAARAATKDAPARRPATSSPPRPSREPTPPRRAEPSASSDRPVAKTSEADPIERVTRPDVPDVTVLRTAWHPDPSRRSARVRLEASEEVLTVKEGDAIGALVLKEISPSAVLFEAGDVEVRRRVGSGS